MTSGIEHIELIEPGASVCDVETRTGRPRVALTYDDGPEPGGTDAVLAVLAALGVMATFFVLLSRTRRYPTLLAETVSAGHEIALHGVDHQRLTLLDPSVVTRRTVDARKELEDTIGRTVTWFRPPYGSQSIATWEAVCRAGLTPVLWSVECYDWLDVPNDQRLAQARAMTAGGAIVLAHDGFAAGLDGVDDGPAPRLDRGVLSRELIALCTEKGFQCGSLQWTLQSAVPVTRVWLTPPPDAAPQR